MRVRDWKLRTKQLASFGVVLLIMAAVHFYTIHKMRSIRVELDEVTTSWLPRALAISDVNLSTSRLRIVQLRHAFTSDPEARKGLTRASVGIIDEINVSLDEYRAMRSGAPARMRLWEEERDDYQTFDEAWEAYQDLSFRFYELLDQEATLEAVELLDGEGQQVFASMSASLTRLVAVNRLEARQAASRAADTFHSARGISTLLLLATIALSVFIAGALVHLITVPVTALERASDEVAGGDLNVRLEEHGSDEIGRLARSFNQMTQALREARAEREQQAEQLRVQNQELAEALRELETAQQQLLLREKMASLGDLVAGVTHELNTPIGAAQSAVDVASRCAQRIEAAVAEATAGLTADQRQALERAVPALEQNLANTRVATDRILAIVNSLRNFARLDEAEHQAADLHEGLDSTLTLMHAELLGHIAVERRYGDLPMVDCNPGHVHLELPRS
jgi:methyl-accepting chemotaxis protein